MPSPTKTTHVAREERLRKKLLNNELNPIVDLLLSLVLLVLSPFIWMFGLIHDKIMFKFLNKTYIYNVSWEVSIISLDKKYYFFTDELGRFI